MKYLITFMAALCMTLTIVGCEEGFQGDLDRFTPFDELEGIAGNTTPSETPGEAPPALETEEEALKPSEIAADPDSYAGTAIVVEGVAKFGGMCTIMACTPLNECCNTCSGAVVLTDIEVNAIGAIVLKAGEGVEGEFSCSGTNCEQSCPPLTLGMIYRVRGTFVKEERPELPTLYYLAVEEYELVEGQEPPSPEVTTPFADPSEIYDNGSAYENGEYRVRGKVAPSGMMCTLMACLDGTQCCNTCTGSMGIIDMDATDNLKMLQLKPATSLGTEFTCGGQMCSPTCSPLANGELYVVTGTVKVDVTNKYYIEVQSFEPMMD